MTYDPTKEQAIVEEVIPGEDGGAQVTVRVSVQDGNVVSGSFFVGLGEGIKTTDIKNIPWEKVGRKALKAGREASDEEGEST